MAWRKWLAEKGGGGPDYANTERPEPYRANSGRLDRRALLDRHSQHTANCSACSKVCNSLYKRVLFEVFVGGLMRF